MWIYCTDPACEPLTQGWPLFLVSIPRVRPSFSCSRARTWCPSGLGRRWPHSRGDETSRRRWRVSL